MFFANIVFFVLTALKIRCLKQELETRLAGHRSSFNHKKFRYERKHFKITFCSMIECSSIPSYTLYLRLLTVMGVTWALDAISFLDPDGYFFLISDICNGAQGTIIFMLFVLKKKIFLQVKERSVTHR